MFNPILAVSLVGMTLSPNYTQFLWVLINVHIQKLMSNVGFYLRLKGICVESHKISRHVVFIMFTAYTSNIVQKNT